MEASVVSPARMGGLRAAVRGLWDAARGYQRLAYLVGAGLILIGLTHAAIWALAGGSASGALSWRKPTTFGISFGLTTLTLGWVATHLLAAQVTGVWMLLHGLALLAAALLAAPAVAAVAAVAAHHRHLPSPRTNPMEPPVMVPKGGPVRNGKAGCRHD